MTASFATIASHIREDAEDKAERRAQQLLTWSAEIELHDPQHGVSTAAEHACQWIKGSEPSDADVAAIACALFRELAKHAHVETNRDAMACLVDMVAEFSAAAREAAQRAAEWDGVRDPDDAYDTLIDNQRSEAA